MSLSTVKSSETDRPAVDEWGIYDPDQAGLAAVIERVDKRRRAAAELNANLMANSMAEGNALLNVARTARNV